MVGCAQCELSRRQALAEREMLTCTRETARINCTLLARLFFERATFALRLPRPGSPLVHAKAMQLQCGGLRGLQTAIAAPVADVHLMILKTQVNEASLLDLPWGEIVAAIVAWQSRRRASAEK